MMPSPSTTLTDVTIRLSPFVFIRRLILTEIGFALLAVGLSFLVDYSALFGALPFADLFPVNIVSASLLTLMQILVIVSSFLSWYFESYTLRPNSIVHRSGASFGERELVAYQDIKTVSFGQSWLETSYNFGTLRMTVASKKPVYVKNIPNPAYYARLIRDKLPVTDPKTNGFIQLPLAKLLKQKEGKNLEFKSSFFWDYKLKQPNKDLRKAILKNVAGLMNTEGGVILVGVDDRGKVIGLARDIEESNRRNLDSIENMFNQSFTATIGAEFRQYMDVEFSKVKNLDVCLITVYPSPKPVYLVNGNGEEFYIRTGNSCQPLGIRQAVEYIRGRF